MLELVPLIRHLPAPAQVCSLQLDRFSPYFRDPVSFGMTEVEPEAVYRVLYPRDSIDLFRLAYRFQYHSTEQRSVALGEAWTRLEAAVAEWRDNSGQCGLWWQSLDERIVITQQRDGLQSHHWLCGAAAELYRLCNHGITAQRIRERMPAMAPSLVNLCLERWRRCGWIFRFTSGVHLALAVELEPKPVEAADESGSQSEDERPSAPLLQLTAAQTTGGGL
jgi:hypothetical protein